MHTLADKDSVIGTPFWMSPEVISKSKYNKKTGKKLIFRHMVLRNYMY